MVPPRTGDPSGGGGRHSDVWGPTYPCQAQERGHWLKPVREASEMMRECGETSSPVKERVGVRTQ